MKRTLAAAVVAVALWSPQARAQSKEDVARADALFNAAKALLDSGQFADACAKFAESKRLAPGLGVTLYLADCYERIGRTASAWTEFRSAEGLARERNDKRADVARDRAQALEPKLDRITIAVAPTVPRDGLQVLRDGVRAAPEEWGLAVPVDPGDHVVVVSSPGHKPRSFSAHVGPEKPAVTITIDSLDEPAGPAAPAPTPTTVAPAPSPTAAPAPTSTAPPETAAAASPGSTMRGVGIALAALGVVGVGAGTVFGLVAKSKLDDSNTNHCDATDHCDSAGLGLRQDAGSAATFSTIGFVAGGAVLAAGVVLYVVAPRGTSASGVVVAPAPMAGGGGAVVRGGF